MTESGAVTFEPIKWFRPGIIERLLLDSYAGLPADEEQLRKYHLQWQTADRQTFDNPETIGQCTFITCLDGEPIGLGSFDPREAPLRGVIGQNCILPAYRGRGFGRRQLEEVVRRLRTLGLASAVVTTGADDFFLPARRMYEACGFREIRRVHDDRGDIWRVEYARTLE